MSQGYGWDRPASPPNYFWSPDLPAAALSGVRTRRILAWFIDLVFISMICLILFVPLGIMGLLTFGLSWFLIPPLYPLTAFFYNGLFISGGRMATPGMAMMDLEMRLNNGAPPPFLNAAVQALFFYLSWSLTPLIFLVSLLDANKRCLHDMLAGVIVTRRAY